MSGGLVQASNGKLYGMTNSGGSMGYGVIFSFNPSTSTYAKLKDFDGTNGGNPYGSLVQASDGKLYGMTYQGGSMGYGVIFSFNPSSATYAKRKDFDGTNGGNPYGSLIQASDGKLYGMTYSGGNSNYGSDYGVLFSYNPATLTYAKLKDFNSMDGGAPMGSLVQASDGKLYGMTSGWGGNVGKGTSFSFDPSASTFKMLAVFEGRDGVGPDYPSGGSPAYTSFIEMSTCTSNVIIKCDPDTSICAGTKVTFTATATNAGTNTSYQWKKNALNIGSNSNIYVDSTFKNGDSVYCLITTNKSCGTVTAKSNVIKMTVNAPVTPTISITTNPGTGICAGNKATFTATVTNAGASPMYQWKKNGINIGTNNNSYVDSTLKNGDSIYCVLTGNAPCATASTVNSNAIKMTVNNPVTPIVSITANPGTSICTGNKVTFTATVTNAGASPVYQWKKNGANIGTNNNTYNDSTLKNGDSIYCSFASNGPCTTTSIVNSNGIKMTVNNPVTPAISIAVTSGTSVCAGNKVTFTATATNGGTLPVYQWKKNGVNVGTSSNTYIVDTALKNNDSVYCVLTSNAACAISTAKSNSIKMTVNNLVTPTVSIATSPGTSVCAGTKVTFTATITNGGTTPVYQWKKNGINVGTNGNTYVVDTALKNGDSIYCSVTSNATCATPVTVQSNIIRMTVNLPVTPTVSITANPGANVCTGNKVIFTATATNGGASPVYQWKKNGANIGTNSNTFNDSTLKNGDSIYCTLASNAPCATASIVNSNAIKMTVNNPITPTISIAVSPGTSVCAGTIVTFTATITNGGTAPAFQWMKNGINISGNKTFVDTALKTVIVSTA
jgi:uncharacterized repeat protein (TIGR03803 family)